MAKEKTDRARILRGAMELLEKRGMEGVNARAIAAHIGCSTQPIYHVYAGMAELRADMVAACGAEYEHFIAREKAGGQYPPYKAMGMAYARFAAERPNLFRLLFMRDRTGEPYDTGEETFRAATEAIHRTTGLPLEAAAGLHLEMWIFVHGIGVLLATGYYAMSMEQVGELLSAHYGDLLQRYSARGSAGAERTEHP